MEDVFFFQIPCTLVLDIVFFHPPWKQSSHGIAGTMFGALLVGIGLFLVAAPNIGPAWFEYDLVRKQKGYQRVRENADAV